MRTTINYKGQTIKQNSEHRFYVDRFNDEYDGVVMFTSEDRAKAYIDKHLTYDVVFNNESDSNSKGGIVSVVCNETGETVYSEEIR